MPSLAAKETVGRNTGQLVSWALVLRPELSAWVPSPLAGAEGQDEGSAMNDVDAVDMSL